MSSKQKSDAVSITTHSPSCIRLIRTTVSMTLCRLQSQMRPSHLRGHRKKSNPRSQQRLQKTSPNDKPKKIRPVQRDSPPRPHRLLRQQQQPTATLTCLSSWRTTGTCTANPLNPSLCPVCVVVVVAARTPLPPRRSTVSMSNFLLLIWNISNFERCI